MNAVVFGDDGGVHVREVPRPQAGRGEVLIKVDYCGICGSDLHAAPPDFRAGVTMGHEFAGEIVDVGAGVTGWTVGDRACVNPNGDWCGTCAYCRAGEVNMCPRIWDTVVGLARNGGMAPFAAVAGKTLHRLPAGVSSLQGAWVEPLAVAIRTVRNSGIGLGDRAVVFGAGPIGLLVIQVLRSAGVGEITAVEPSALRAALAARCGAHAIVNPRSEDVLERFADPVTAPRFAFECTGVAAVTETALRVLGPRGRLTVTGFARENPFYRAQDLLFKELEIRGSFIYVDEFEIAIDLLDRGAIDVEPLVTDVRPFASGPDAFEAMRRSDSAVKIMLSGA
jgi:(R,R)-butanediol dehydrogenase/meso-butanediol dehydrogenase/diacetyl reductase